MAKPGDKFYTDMRGIHADAIATDNGFKVLAGSTVRNHEASYLAKAVRDQRDRCLSDGTIVDWTLTRDIEFKSPSAAAVFLFGANASGPATWKNADGITMLKLDKVAEGKMDSVDSEYTGFFKTVTGNEGSKCYYPTRLDTYGCGCGHDCSYCYAKDMLINYGDNWDPLHPKYADLDRIETKLKKIAPGTILRLGGLTDCFQPIELKKRVTLETIKMMNRYGIGYLIVTKSHHVADKEYLDVMEPELAHIQITTTTFDEKLCAKNEKASKPSRRVESIEKLCSLGYDTFLRLSPYIDGWIDFDKLNKVQCDKILVEFLRVNTTIAKRFGVNPNDFPVRDAGYRHYTLEHKMEVLSQITGFKEVSVCEDNTEHYKFFKTHFNPNENDCCNLRKKQAFLYEEI